MNHTLPKLLLPALAFLLLAPLHAAPAAPQPGVVTTFTLIAPDLSPIPIGVTAWTDAGIRFTDHNGAEREAARGTIAALAPPNWTPGATPVVAIPDLPIRRGWAGVLELTDGQRLVGRPSVDSESTSADHIAWTHPRLGVLSVPIDRVARLRTGVGSGAPPDLSGIDREGDDLVILVNGDHIRGLVEQIAANVTIATGNIADANGGGTIEVALDRVREVLLTNPAAEPRGTVLWFDDGTVLAADAVAPRATSSALVLAVRPDVGLGSREGSWRLDELEAINFDAARLRGLAAVPFARHDRLPGSERLRIEPARLLSERRPGFPGMADENATAPLWAADIELPGPMLVEWKLPEGAARLAGWAELPQENWTWGDCVLVIADGHRELHRVRLNAQSPLARFDVPLASPNLRITLEPGEHGPIQDRIILRRVLISMDPR